MIPLALCPYYLIGKVGLKKYNYINYPLQDKCHNYKYTHNISLQKVEHIWALSKTPVSVLYKIVKLWIQKNQKAKQIKRKLEDEYNKEDVNIKVIYEIITIVRKAIATFILNIYQIDRLALSNENNVI